MRSGCISEVAISNTMKAIRGENASKAFTLCRRRRPGTKRSPFSQSNRPGKCDVTGFEWTDKISGCPVFYPSNEEFQDPLSYLRKISAEASNYGM